jgi:hypothetical protein
MLTGRKSWQRVPKSKVGAMVYEQIAGVTFSHCNFIVQNIDNFYYLKFFET